MYECVFVRVCLCANTFVFVCLNVSVCKCDNVLYKVIHGTFSLQILPFFGRKRFGITPFFKTSKQLFQPRFHLSVSPDCKMCVRVTNTRNCSGI